MNSFKLTASTGRGSLHLPFFFNIGFPSSVIASFQSLKGTSKTKKLTNNNNSLQRCRSSESTCSTHPFGLGSNLGPVVISGLNFFFVHALYQSYHFSSRSPLAFPPSTEKTTFLHSNLFQKQKTKALLCTVVPRQIFLLIYYLCGIHTQY